MVNVASTRHRPSNDHEGHDTGETPNCTCDSGQKTMANDANMPRQTTRSTIVKGLFLKVVARTAEGPHRASPKLPSNGQLEWMVGSRRARLWCLSSRSVSHNQRSQAVPSPNNPWPKRPRLHSRRMSHPTTLGRGEYPNAITTPPEVKLRRRRIAGSFQPRRNASELSAFSQPPSANGRTVCN